MTFVLLQNGEVGLFAGTWSTATASQARLFMNDVTAGLTDTEINELDTADFSEANFTGYAAQSLSSWTTTSGAPSDSTHDELTWTCTAAPASPQRIYGYYITRNSDSVVIGFEVFNNGPFNIFTANNTIEHSPQITLD